MLYFAPWKMVVVALVCVIGITFSLPNFLSRETAESLSETVPARQLNLGLDLQGGSYALLQVGVDEVIQDKLSNREDAIRNALRSTKIDGKRVRYRNLGVDGDAVTLTLTKPEQFEEALDAIRGTSVELRFNLLTGTGGGEDAEVEIDEAGKVSVRFVEQAITETVDRVVEQAVEVLRRRVDELGVAEPTIQRQGNARILLQLPGFSELPPMEQAQMTFRMVDPTVSAAQVRQGATTLPPGSEQLESYDRNDDGSPQEHFVVRKKVLITGEHLVDAQATYDRGQPVVSFRFDTEGGKIFGDITAANVGRPFAIILDDKVISAPVIRDAILGGSGIITGNFTVPEAQKLALLLRAGALPAAIKVIEQRTVGPSLGQDAIDAGKIAAIIAFAMVMVFMVLSYGVFGLAADIALVINLFLIMGFLSMLQATLTLPGIAGIVLTIGMAVDANVLVFERIREEIRTGKTPFAAMDAGYQRALGTILDANVTTFLAATILFAMGSGPVRGFAVTLGIGILTSVFTAVTVTRLMLVLWLRRTRPAALPV